jgi:hypothetical protein
VRFWCKVGELGGILGIIWVHWVGYLSCQIQMVNYVG